MNSRYFGFREMIFRENLWVPFLKYSSTMLDSKNTTSYNNMASIEILPISTYLSVAWVKVMNVYLKKEEGSLTF